MKNYRFGFSLKGLISFILVMIPNVIWMIFPPANNILAENGAANPALDIISSVSQGLMIVSLIFLINRTSSKLKRATPFIGTAAFCLAGYYILWVCYFAGVINPWFFVGMAVLPSVYFILVELWMRNYIALIPSVVFGVAHIAIAVGNYL